MQVVNEQKETSLFTPDKTSLPCIVKFCHTLIKCLTHFPVSLISAKKNLYIFDSTELTVSLNRKKLSN